MITTDEAQAIFRKDNARFRSECLGLVKVSLHAHEFDALCSFIFNLGTTQFRGSTALARLNAKDYAGCAEAMRWWNKPPEDHPAPRGRGATVSWQGVRGEVAMSVLDQHADKWIPEPDTGRPIWTGRLPVAAVDRWWALQETRSRSYRVWFVKK